MKEDHIVWKKDVDGEYSVKSAYQRCMQEILDLCHFKVQGAWDIIRKLKMSSKVKKIIWRICRNCLPARMRLRDKGVNCDTTFAFCNLEDEDNLRLFFRCPSSCNIWSIWEGYSSISNILSQAHDIKTMIFNILQVLGVDDAAIFCCILWSIWKQKTIKFGIR